MGSAQAPPALVRFGVFEADLRAGDALLYFDGSCEICMIDNTHVVVLQGTGRNMVPVPEMASFAERYGFQFKPTRRAMRIVPLG